MTKKGFIDEITEVLKNCRKSSPYAYVSPDNEAEFFAPAASQGQPEPEYRPQPARPERTPRPAAQPMRGQNEYVPQPPTTAKAPQADFSALSLEELAGVAKGCTACRLHGGRTNVVFGDGAANAELMFIGEGPGQDEDLQGRPFVGLAGQLLDKMITAMQFNRGEVYIANIVKCRPPDNRNPHPDEAAACLPYLERQIELIRPRVIVVLGSVPLEFLMRQKGIRKLRGQWLEYHGIPVMPTYHPAYLLRYPEAKKEVWADLQQVMKVFGKVHTKQ